MSKTQIAVLVTAAQVAEAKSVYDAALESVKNAIQSNQETMRNFRNNKNADTKAAYDASRANHKAAIAHIKTVRPIWKQLREQFASQPAPQPEQAQAS